MKRRILAILLAGAMLLNDGSFTSMAVNSQSPVSADAAVQAQTEETADNDVDASDESGNIVSTPDANTDGTEGTEPSAEEGKEDKAETPDSSGTDEEATPSAGAGTEDEADVSETPEETDTTEPTEETEEIFETSVSGDTVTITKYNPGTNPAEELVIPEELKGKSNIKIRYNVFKDCASITSVVLPDTVTEIGYNAFSGCENLKSVSLGNGVKTIGYNAFSGCTALKTITIPKSVTAIGSSSGGISDSIEEIIVAPGTTKIPAYACYKASNLTKAVIPDTVTEIGSSAFQNCPKLVTADLPDSVKTIGNNAFSGCTGLTFVNLKDNLTSIGYNAFSGCTALKTITIPKSVTTIGSYYGGISDSIEEIIFAPGTTKISAYACYKASNLTKAVIPDTVTEIGSYAFQSCPNLVTADLPDSVKTIGSYAYNNCTKLAFVNPSSGLTSISDNAFSGCTALTKITIPKSVTSIGSSAFNGSIAEIAFEEGMTKIPDRACYNASNLTKVTIPSTAAEIGAYAFSSCKQLTNIDLPDAVAIIGSNAFQSCIALVKVHLGSKVETIKSYTFSGCTVLADINLDGKIKTIENYAFQYCTGLTSIRLGSGVETIGSSAFYGCKQLASINLNGAVKSIGSSAFCNCEKLEPVLFGSSLTTIGSSAFSGCVLLETVTIPKSVTNIGSSAFQNSATKVIFESGTTSIPANACNVASKLTEAEIPSTVTEIGNNAFSGCTVLEKITLSANITKMGTSVFSGCSALTSITIPRTLVTIGNNCFNNSIEEIVFQDGITKIPDNVCYGASKLKTIHIPRTVTEIGQNAFNNCSSLTQVKIADNMTVGNYAFNSCSALEDLTVGDNVTLGDYVFRYCRNLKSIKLGKNLVKGREVFGGISIKGQCGDNLSWELNADDGQLSLSGNGAMEKYASAEQVPWSGLMVLIEDISFNGNITTISDYAFRDCDNLETIIIKDGITQIGKEAFYSCDNLIYVELPDSLQVLGSQAFGECNKLEELLFCGNAPSLGAGCLPDIKTLTVYYPETATGWTPRLLNRYGELSWKIWDNTVLPNDIVLVLDISGSMSNKMAKLKEASSAFIKGIGGMLSNTRISVVAYESNAKVISEFSMNYRHQIRQVEKLKSTGGTHYLNALKCADGLLEGSSAARRAIIMFSDGEPNDSKTDISAFAQELREKYEIYTVGLLSGKTQREVLIDVAGKEENYFEVTAIDKLLQVFLQLSEDFGKSETTTFEVKRHGQRVDLINEEQIICIGSDETMSIIITAGTKFDDVAKIALMQDDTVVLENTTGEFNDIKPGKLFKVGGRIYAALYDSKGNIIEKTRLNITIRDNYTVTYMMNDDTDTVYRTDKIIDGKEIMEPDAPVRDGYKFDGWYSSEECTGYSFFHEFNVANRQNLENDITLYAKWEADSTVLDLATEAFSFTNSGRFFCNSNWGSMSDEQRDPYYYEISDGDCAQLYDSASANKSWIKDLKDSSWGGSCFGMSSAVCLSKDEMLDISNFNANFTNIGQASMIMNTNGDADVGDVESMINYYMLRQQAGRIYDIRTDYTSSESDNLKKIINKMKSGNGITVVCIGLSDSEGSAGGHAVVSHGFEEDTENNTYRFQIYDCSMGNERSFPVTVTKNGDTYTKECSEWEQAWNYSITFKAALTADDLAQETLLTAPTVVRAGASGGSGSSSTYDLNTSYANFTISTGTKTAEIVNGQLAESSTLQVMCYGLVSEPKMQKKYLFRLPALTSGAYTITPASGADTYKTVMYYADSADGFFISEDAAEPGEITISDTGKMSTVYTTATAHTSHVSSNQMTTPWYYIGVEGENTGLSLDPQADTTTVAVSADAAAAAAEGDIEGEAAQDVKVKIRMESDFNYVEASSVSVDTTGVEIKTDENNNCIIQKDDKVIFTDGFGYSVVYDSQCGTSVETLTGVAEGTILEEPNDPRRDGYIFEGWFKEKDCKNLWNFKSDKVTGNTTLYAGWSVDTNYFLSVTFKRYGKEDQSIYVPKGNALKLSECPKIPDDLDQNWYTDNKYTKVWDFEKGTITKNTVLYAKGKEYTITYESDPAGEPTTETGYAGNRIVKPEDPKKDGYKFTGWFKDSECSQEWDFYLDIITSDVTLHAGWEEIIYTVKFDPQKEGIDPSLYPDYTGVKPGTKIQEPAKPQDIYYEFTGWYKDAECRSQWNFDTDTVNGDMTLYGGWKEIFYTVTFDVNGHGTALAEYADYNAIKPMSLIEEPAAPVAAGYVFTGWYRDKDGLILWNFNQDTVQGDTTLYAGWKIDEDYDGVLPGDSGPQTGLWVAGIKDQTYTGKAIRPEVRVYDGRKRLKVGKDYTLSYKNNVKAADEKAGKKAPTVTIKTKGNYSGTFTSTFTIKKAALTQDNLIAAKVYPAGKAYTPVVMLGSNILKAKKDYTLTYLDANGSKTKKRPTKEGDYFIQIKGKGNCEGDFRVAYKVAKNGGISIGKGQATVAETHYGDKDDPATTLKVAGKDLQAGTHYSVRFSGTSKAGTAAATFIGSGEYTGTLKKNFKVQPLVITKEDITVAESAAYEKGGARPSVTVRVNNVKLSEGTDYTLTYANNKKLGQAKVTVKGKGNYTGKAEKTFQVVQKDLAASGVQIFVSDAVTGKTPTVLIFDTNGKKLAAKSDYQANDNKDGTVTITGGNNGLYTVSEPIVRNYRQLEKDKVITSVSLNKKADGFPKTFKYTGGRVELKNSWLKVKVGNTVLTDKDFEIKYITNIQKGTATVVVQGKGEYGGSKVLNFKIQAQNVPKVVEWFSSKK